jgi:hypothetical protein
LKSELVRAHQIRQKEDRKDSRFGPDFLIGAQKMIAYKDFEIGWAFSHEKAEADRR